MNKEHWIVCWADVSYSQCLLMIAIIVDSDVYAHLVPDACGGCLGMGCVGISFWDETMYSGSDSLRPSRVISVHDTAELSIMVCVVTTLVQEWKRA